MIRICIIERQGKERRSVKSGLGGMTGKEKRVKKRRRKGRQDKARQEERNEECSPSKQAAFVDG